MNYLTCCFQFFLQVRNGKKNGWKRNKIYQNKSKQKLYFLTRYTIKQEVNLFELQRKYEKYVLYF